MKKSMLVFGFLLMILVVFQATGGPAGETVEPTAAEVSVEPAATQTAPAPESEVEEGDVSLELLPESSPFSEPQPASSCVPFQCRQQCRAECAPGCFCTGSCASGFCECTEICF